MAVATELTPLSVALREETSRAHELAEGSDFMTRLMAGDLNREALIAYTGQLWFVYEALERVVRDVDTPVGDPRLERHNAIESDLAELIGSQWRDEIRILPATARYVARLEAADALPAVVAHHYVRYLGDVSGGQVIAARLSALYGIGTEALSFYDFSAVGKISPYRAAYRAILDEIELTDAERAELIAEAREAFALNSGVFAALSEIFPA